MKKNILLIEDNQSLGSSLVDNLEMEGFHVTWAQDGKAGQTSALESVFDLIILDLTLPFLDGLEILKSVRKKSSVPIIILSARGQQNDRVLGLELQADDYLPKPFHFKELLLRIESIFRRISNQRNSEVINKEQN